MHVCMNINRSFIYTTILVQAFKKDVWNNIYNKLMFGSTGITLYLWYNIL
jgi:hypothetical protein